MQKAEGIAESERPDPHEPCGAPSASPCRRRFVETLYRLHWNDICGWLRRRFGPGPPAPEDIAQTAFERISALESVAHIRYPKSFLYRTAANAALDAIGHVRRTRSFLDDELKRKGQDLEEMTPEYVSLSKERIFCMNKAIEQLPSKQREIVIRCRLRGETYDQVAAATGWSKSDVFRQLKSALVVIRAALDAYENDEMNEERGHD